MIIDAVVFGMIDVGELRRLHHVARFDFWIALGATLGVLSAGVLFGVLIGIALSLCWLIYVATTPPMPLLGREPGTHAFRDLVENPDDETVPGVAVLRLDGSLSFATAEAVVERVRGLAESEPELRLVVLDLEGADFVDSQGSAALREIHEFLERRGVGLELARVKPQVRDVVEADGVLDDLGPNHVHATLKGAVDSGLGAAPLPVK